MAESARQRAAELLLRMHREQGYSQILLDRALREETWTEADRALLSRLVYGAEERRLTLDWFLGQCTRAPLKRAHPAVLEILRVGAYQLLFMDRIPASAAVNEAVKIAKTMGQGHAAGFVNGVLRSLDRRREELWRQLPEGEAGEEIRYSCPRALIRLWREAYGEERTAELLAALNEVPPAVIRVNTLRTTPEEWAREAAQAGMTAENVPGLPAALRLTGNVSWKKLDFLGEKWYYQDVASQWCVEALDPQPGERVADVCAAPGGKRFTAAQKMRNSGRILSGDVYAAKCEEMERRAALYGITVLETVTRDASAPCPAAWAGAFDRVLCDVPCSGFGVIRRKPEIRYKSLEAVAELPALQYRILEQAARMVRPGGVLQYSTCTLNPAENEQVAERFLREHPEFEPRVLPIAPVFERLAAEPSWRVTLFPSVHGSDGFFIAGFQRRGEGA